jgi:hypothetical protein
VQSFLDEQAADGRLVDRASVSALMSPDGKITAVSETRSRLNDIIIATNNADGVDGPMVLGASWEQADEESEAAATAYASIDSGAGLGANGLAKPKNGKKVGGTCSTVTAHSHRLTQCYEKWKASDSSKTYDAWVYNRWGTATARGDGLLHVYNVKELTLRTRPWKGYRDRLASMTDYWPHSGSEVCRNQGSVTVNAGAFSATLPFGSCSQSTILENATAISMGMQWKGSAKSQVATDYAFAVNSWAGRTPIFADYGWAEFGDTQTICPGACIDTQVVAAWDEGFA